MLNNYNPEITLAILISLCALLSAPITTIINNIFTLIYKWIEVRHQRYKETSLYKRKIFENYLSFIGFSNLTEKSELEEYGKVYLLAYMYAPDNLKEKMSTAHQLVINKECESADKLLEEIAKELGTVLKKM